MTEIEPTDSSTGRRRFLVRAIVASQATIGAAVALVFGATTLSPSFLRRQETWLRAADLESLPENQPVSVTLRVTRHDGYTQVVYRTIVHLVRVGERCGPRLSDCVVARQHIRIPGRIGLPCLPARKDAGRMRKDQCVAFRLYS
jgi:hypothetical protein